MIDLFTLLNHWGGALQSPLTPTEVSRDRQTDKPLLPRCLQLEVPEKQSQQMYGRRGQPTRARRYRHCCLLWISALALRVAGRQREWPVQGAAEGHSWTFLACHGFVKCEKRQSGSALLARLGFAAISRRDLHCRVCRGREESVSGKEAGQEAGKHGSMH